MCLVPQEIQEYELLDKCNFSELLYMTNKYLGPTDPTVSKELLINALLTCSKVGIGTFIVNPKKLYTTCVSPYMPKPECKLCPPFLWVLCSKNQTLTEDVMEKENKQKKIEEVLGELKNVDPVKNKNTVLTLGRAAGLDLITMVKIKDGNLLKKYIIDELTKKSDEEVDETTKETDTPQAPVETNSESLPEETTSETETKKEKPKPVTKTEEPPKKATGRRGRPKGSPNKKQRTKSKKVEEQTTTTKPTQKTTFTDKKVTDVDKSPVDTTKDFSGDIPIEYNVKPANKDSLDRVLLLMDDIKYVVQTLSDILHSLKN